ncbi:hypothetical protein JZ751_003322 [Albula glossodonta]|uniref:Uncharacterized protein n=1 Tax=Albula glossodonta TaxID=121402 RepID=A0A8T2N7Z3_9TELE|nr:hypothetical protein JZ751_003322 [Albula glossodonta]
MKRLPEAEWNKAKALGSFITLRQSQMCTDRQAGAMRVRDEMGFPCPLLASSPSLCIVHRVPWEAGTCGLSPATSIQRLSITLPLTASLSHRPPPPHHTPACSTCNCVAVRFPPPCLR